MDEIAVEAKSRRKNIGSSLCLGYLKMVQEQGFTEVVLRTDQRNTASMNLFKSMDFESMGIFDPEFQQRVYLRRKLI